MKLYVWVNPYPVRYGSSLLMAVAENVSQARKIAAKAPGYAYGQYRQNGGGDLKLGTPDRIVKLPCAEWHEWSE